MLSCSAIGFLFPFKKEIWNYMLSSSSLGINVISYPIIFDEAIHNFCDNGTIFILLLFSCNTSPNQFSFHSLLLTLRWPWWSLYYVSNIFQNDLMQWIMSLLTLRVEDATLCHKAMKWICTLTERVSKWLAFYKPVFLQWKCWTCSEII